VQLNTVKEVRLWWTYTSQGERPSVDLVRQLLMSCGISCTDQRIAPADESYHVPVWSEPFGKRTNKFSRSEMAVPIVPNMFSAAAFTGIAMAHAMGER
jgi:hypothetical protein